MLVAEGVGRKLYPEVNLWDLAKPMIGNWMVENMGPEVQIKATTETILDGLERLPALISNMEETLSASARFRVDPVLTSKIDENRPNRTLWVAVIALTITVCLLL